jgi:galactitol-specific phosphotransferase system IIB component
MGASSLTDSVATYFRRKGYKIERDILWEGKTSGLTHKFDLIITKGNEQRLVWIREWKRTVGVNMVINMDKVAEDVGMLSPIMISSKFSGHAKAYANRRGVTLLTLRKDGVTFDLTPAYQR